jgi:hypothetical protein
MSANPTTAAFFPIDRVPAWQIGFSFGAAIIFFGFLYADRLKNRGYTDGQKRFLEVLYVGLGLSAVGVAFALVVSAASAIHF